MIILDTNVLSEMMRRHPEARVVGWLGQQDVNELATTAISIAEIRFGLLRLAPGRKRTALMQALDGVLEQMGDVVMPFDRTSALRYADIVARREKSGKPISGFDAQIAAICQQHDALLATRNVSDFTNTGIDLRDPWTA